MNIVRQVIPDADMAARINAYRAKHPYASRHELRLHCCVSPERMVKLHAAGLIEKPPAPMNRSISASLNRKRNKIGQNWWINRPPEWAGK